MSELLPVRDKFTESITTLKLVGLPHYSDYATFVVEYADGRFQQGSVEIGSDAYVRLADAIANLGGEFS